MLNIDSISKSYGSKKILEDISFTADKSQIIGIIGHNGCGKSTLLKILSGALKPDSGTLLYNDLNLTKNHKYFSKYIGYVPQENPLIDELSGLDNLKLWYVGNNSKLKSELSNGFLHQLGIYEYVNMPVSKMSGGMKKRLSICAILYIWYLMEIL